VILIFYVVVALAVAIGVESNWLTKIALGILWPIGLGDALAHYYNTVVNSVRPKG